MSENFSLSLLEKFKDSKDIFFSKDNNGNVKIVSRIKEFLLSLSAKDYFYLIASLIFSYFALKIVVGFFEFFKFIFLKLVKLVIFFSLAFFVFKTIKRYYP